MRTRGNAFIVTLVVLVAMVAMACSSSPSSDNASTDSAGGDSATTVSPADADPYVGFTSDQYTGDTNWLCRPGKAASACDNNLDATAINGDGTTTVKPFTKAADPPIDCFYVYPTISGDKGANSDLNAGDEEKATVEGQAARFAEHCRVFAPVYRQIPLAALIWHVPGKRHIPPRARLPPRVIACGSAGWPSRRPWPWCCSSVARCSGQGSASRRSLPARTWRRS
jgi:hypothetical protein